MPTKHRSDCSIRNAADVKRLESGLQHEEPGVTLEKTSGWSIGGRADAEAGQLDAQADRGRPVVQEAGRCRLVASARCADGR